MGIVLGCVVVGASSCGAASPTGREPPDDLWGFADLHAHPAFHFAYGAKNGENGVMWGKPGLAWAGHEATLDHDLGACDPDQHGSTALERSVLLGMLTGVTQGPHGASGFPDFKTWPAAIGDLHQQMHVRWLRRAWEGGQRVLVASAVENLTLAWAADAGLGVPDPGHTEELASVDAQLDFIKAMVAANSDWMNLVKSAQEAHDAIQAGHLAVVLGTEVDTLTKQDLLDYFEKGVRVFIPIHLANNTLGGTAVYENMFNAHNWYLNHAFYEVVTDPNLSFHLDPPLAPMDFFGFAAIDPVKLLDPPMVPEKSGPGEKNKIGLTAEGKAAIEELFAKGAIIDVAHMGEQSTADTIELAANWMGGPMPIIDSHTGVRLDGQLAKSERDLLFSHARAIGELHGMLGIGTGGITADKDTTPERIFFNVDNGAFATLGAKQSSRATPDIPMRVVSTATCKGLSVAIGTGDDDLRQDSIAKLEVTTKAGSAELVLNHGFAWQPHETNRVMLGLPDALVGPANELAIDLVHEDNCNLLQRPDKWLIDSMDLRCGPRVLSHLPAVDPLSADKPLEPFVGDHRWSTPVSTTDASPTSALLFDLWTGAHPLPACISVDVEVQTTDATLVCPNVTAGTSLDAKSLRRARCALGTPIPMSSLQSVALHTHGSCSGAWDLAGITIGAEEPANPGVPLDVVDGQITLDGSATINLASIAQSQKIVRLTIHSTSSGLEKGSNATGTFTFRDGSTQTFDINRGAAFKAGYVKIAGVKVFAPLDTRYQVFVLLQGNEHTADIQNLRIDAPNLTSDWGIAGVTLEAFEDPVLAWTEEYQKAVVALGRKDGYGVALGTDLNGLAPTIAITGIDPYPLGWGRIINAKTQPVDPNPQKTGNKIFDITKDGIAHVGMLPDFLAAAAKNGEAEIAPVFHSAHDFVDMWQTIEAHAQSKDAGPDASDAGAD